MNATFDGIDYTINVRKSGRSKSFDMSRDGVLVGQGQMFSRTGNYHVYIVRDGKFLDMPGLGEFKKTVPAAARAIHNALKGGK